MARELPALPPKAAYCLAALPALHQGHVLSLVPTGVPVSMALQQLGEGACAAPGALCMLAVGGAV